MYHDLAEADASASPYSISVKAFTDQLRTLKRTGFETISFAFLFDALERDRNLPSKCAIITFDDGYESFRTRAVPALNEHGMSATVFLVAGELGGSNRWDQADGISSKRLMNEQQIHEALEAGMEIGAHGWKHRDLTACTTSELQEETAVAKKKLEQLFEQRISAFAYPHGRYNETAMFAVREAGYRGAVSIFSREPSVADNPYAMRRVYVHAGDGPTRFRIKLSRLYLRFMAWRGDPSQ
jgi:peptidoglycan/xylan/chitin deacetylase (PgdA/CDA1 family)